MDELRRLLLKSLGEMLFVERTLAEEVLPDLREQVTNEHFREAVDEHIEQTRGHVANLERVFEELGEAPQAEESRALDGLRLQHEAVLAELDDAAVRDVANANAAAHTEHFEISAYHSLISAAATLGEPEVVPLLEQNLREEEEALEKVEKTIPERLAAEFTDR